MKEFRTEGNPSAIEATYEGRPLYGDNQPLSAQGPLVTSDAWMSVPVTVPTVRVPVSMKWLQKQWEAMRAGDRHRRQPERTLLYRVVQAHLTT